MTEKNSEAIFKSNDYDRMLSYAARKEASDSAEDKMLAVKIYEKCAAQNIPEAFIKLGNMYLTGELLEKDFNKATECFAKACTLGCADGYYRMGCCHLSGTETKQDFEKAFMFFSLGALIGHDVNCYCKLGDMFVHGDYAEKNEKTAFLLYMKALNILEEGSMIFEHECEADILFRIGKCFLYGKGTETNFKNALWYLESAAYGYKKHGRKQDDKTLKAIAEISEMTEFIKKSGYSSQKNTAI